MRHNQHAGQDRQTGLTMPDLITSQQVSACSIIKAPSPVPNSVVLQDVDPIAAAKAKVDAAEQAMWQLRYHIDPQGWKAIKAYVDGAIEYQLLLAQKEATHA
jgi:hypothetical protein